MSKKYTKKVLTIVILGIAVAIFFATTSRTITLPRCKYSLRYEEPTQNSTNMEKSGCFGGYEKCTLFEGCTAPLIGAECEQTVEMCGKKFTCLCETGFEVTNYK